jgi:superfamily II DNA or RNA helicase
VGGGWAKAKVLRSLPEPGLPLYEQATEVDRDVLQLMRAMPNVSASYYSYSNHTKVAIEGNYGVQAVQRAGETGRLFINDGNGQPLVPATWSAPRALHWQWVELPQGTSSDTSWTLAPLLGNPGTAVCLGQPPLYLDEAQGQVGPADLQGLSAGEVMVLLKTPPMQTQALQAVQAELAQQLGSLPMPPVLTPIPEVQGGTPKACLHLRPNAPHIREDAGLVTATLQFDYAGLRGWWTGTGPSVLVDGPQGRVRLLRDPQAELESVMWLIEHELQHDGHGEFVIPGDESQSQWLEWGHADFAPLREAGFELTLDAAMQDWVRNAENFEVVLHPAHAGADPDADAVASSPWFDLSLGMEIDGQRQNVLPWLPKLIAMAAQAPLDEQTGQPQLPPYTFLDTPEGNFIRIPTEPLRPWLLALMELVGDRNHDFSGDSLKLSRLDALRTTASLGQGVIWAGAQHLRDMVEQLKGGSGLPAVPIPASVQATLHPYQEQGVHWLQFLREHDLAGILADDMGLGKTLQTLAHIQIEKDAGRLTHPALIVAPVSLMGNWRREAERFCPQLRCLVVHGKDRHEVIDHIGSHDLVIAPYSLLHRDRAHWLKTKWHLVVLDEAQAIKNANTQAAQLVGELNTAHRLCLSGTPMENHLGEIWSLFHFLMPGFLGSQKRFTELFRTPIEKRGDTQALRQLRARVTPFMLRRTKALVAHELPPKVETVMQVELAGKQADLYETIRLSTEATVRAALENKGLAKSHITILDALLKLRQVCCDPRLLKLESAQKVKTSAKLEQLMDMLPEMLAEGRRILLFSQFTSMLSLIEVELAARKIEWVKLTGQSQNRDDLIGRFTSGRVPLFLISLKAGGVGLNLPQADTVIHYDPWWNPAVENQATDRAHRIGQTQSVWVVKLVAQGTIEERILALQERKAALAQGMYSDAAERKQPLFTESDLAELLRPLSA